MMANLVPGKKMNSNSMGGASKWTKSPGIIILSKTSSKTYKYNYMQLK